MTAGAGQERHRILPATGAPSSPHAAAASVNTNATTTNLTPVGRKQQPSGSRRAHIDTTGSFSPPAASDVRQHAEFPRSRTRRPRLLPSWSDSRCASVRWRSGWRPGAHHGHSVLSTVRAHAALDARPIRRYAWSNADDAAASASCCKRGYRHLEDTLVGVQVRIIGRVFADRGGAAFAGRCANPARAAIHVAVQGRSCWTVHSVSVSGW